MTVRFPTFALDFHSIKLQFHSVLTRFHAILTPFGNTFTLFCSKLPLDCQVMAKKDQTHVLCVYRQEDISLIKEIYETSLLEKVDFLRAHHDYGYREVKELDEMARLMRRQWLRSGEKLVEAGQDADAIYFVLRGQLSIEADITVDGEAKTKAVNVLGAGCSVGQMGVVLEEKKRTATCVALTDGVVLFCHRYNFLRVLEPRVLSVMKQRATAVIEQNVKQVHTPPLCTSVPRYLSPLGVGQPLGRE